MSCQRHRRRARRIAEELGVKYRGRAESAETRQQILHWEAGQLRRISDVEREDLSTSIDGQGRIVLYDQDEACAMG